MSKTEENLLNKPVTFYLDGGWEVSGVVRTVSEAKIVIENETSGELFLVFREKVSCFKMGTKPQSRITNDYEKNRRHADRRDYSEFPMNKMAYDDSGMTIPQGLLKDLPSSAEDDDFSVTLGGESEQLGAGQNGGIEFRIDDDPKKED